MSTQRLCGFNMDCLLVICCILLAGLSLTEACDGHGINECQRKMTAQAKEVQEESHEQICMLLDSMRDCMIKEANCPEESMKEAFELIKPGLRERFDIRCGSATLQTSFALLCSLSLYLLLVHK